MSSSFASCSLQCRRISGAGALDNPSLLSSWVRKREGLQRVKSDHKGEDERLRNEGGGGG